MDEVIGVIEDEIMSLLDFCRTEKFCEYSNVKNQVAYIELFFEQVCEEFQRYCERTFENKHESLYVREKVQEFMNHLRDEIEEQLDREAEEVAFEINIDYGLLLNRFPELADYDDIKRTIDLNCNKNVKLNDKPIKSEYLLKLEHYSFVRNCSSIESKSRAHYIAGYYYLSLGQGIYETLIDSGKAMEQKIHECREYFENDFYIRSVLQEYFKDCVSRGEHEAEMYTLECIAEVKKAIKTYFDNYDKYWVAEIIQMEGKIL